MRKFLTSLAALSLLGMTNAANATTFVVKALDHSVENGTGTPLNTGYALTVGQGLLITASTDDLWSAGPLPRFSDANGLIAPRYATATDDSGEAIGTQIGDNFGTVSILGFSAPYGALVGRIGSTFQILGTNFSGPAWGNGTLELFYWDTGGTDNFGEIAFEVNALIPDVPEPDTWAMMIFGFGAVGAAMRRRAKVRVIFG